MGNQNFWTVTNLGNVAGMPGAMVNKTLEQLGYQQKSRGSAKQWEPTELGRPFCRSNEQIDKRTSAPYVLLTWDKTAVLPLLEENSPLVLQVRKMEERLTQQEDLFRVLAAEVRKLKGAV